MLKNQNHLFSEVSWVELRKSIIENKGDTVYLFPLSVPHSIDGHNSLIVKWKRIGLRGKEHCWEKWGKSFFVSNWISTLKEIFLISYLILFLFSHWYYLLYLLFPMLWFNSIQITYFPHEKESWLFAKANLLRTILITYLVKITLVLYWWLEQEGVEGKGIMQLEK